MNAIHDYLPILRQTSIFGGLPDKDLEKIYNNGLVITHKEGYEIIKEKTPATEIYVILKGSAKVILHPNHENLAIAQLGTGACFGEISVIGILDHSASVFTKEPSTFMVIPKHFLVDISQNDMRLFSLIILNIAREIARRLYDTDAIVLHYGGLESQEP